MSFFNITDRIGSPWPYSTRPARTREKPWFIPPENWATDEIENTYFLRSLIFIALARCRFAKSTDRRPSSGHELFQSHGSDRVIRVRLDPTHNNRSDLVQRSGLPRLKTGPLMQSKIIYMYIYLRSLIFTALTRCRCLRKHGRIYVLRREHGHV